MLKQANALAIRTRQIRHHCPYKGQHVPIALCYLRSQDIADEFCYGCDQIEHLIEKYGLRTFQRKLVVASCKHCDDAAVLHDERGCARCHHCPGFGPEPDSGLIYVPTNVMRTEWMVVDVATGERRAYVDHRSGWSGVGEARRFHLPLAGAPGTVPADALDDARIAAAALAERKRRGEIKEKKDKKDDKQKARRKTSTRRRS